MHIALAHLSLDVLYVVYPGSKSCPLHKKVRAVPVTAVPSLPALVLQINE